MPDIETRIAALPIWSGPIALEPLVGGLSNPSFAVIDSTGKYAVRVTRDFPFHNVDREREVIAARAAHAAGFAPEIVHAEPGLMVSRFITGKVLTATDIRDDISRIAQFVRRFHTQMPERISGPRFTFEVFHTNRGYVRQLCEQGRVPAAADLWLTVNTELEAAQLPLPTLFGHHDLLPANLIDDGMRLWLIDYEYAGFGTAMFDLGNLTSNSGFSAIQSHALLEAYFDAAPSEPLLRSHAAMEAASLLREALWSLVSAIHLERPGVDYAAYADVNFARFDTALAAYRHRFGADHRDGRHTGVGPISGAIQWAE